ncbi:MAG: hypothetical protein P4M15_11380 [Alphaproteobacteria bacterium]|nr:hypothetical protein [Alphaproteobacteria bacterium]
MSAVPLWAMFGLAAAALSATQMLLQERFRAEPLPVAFWSKVACALVMLPFVVIHGMPHNPLYYALLAAQSLLWVVSDVIFYRGINQASAGVISRVLPMATILSFFLWLAIDWTTARAYIAAPAHSAAIVAVLCLLAAFAWRLKNCAVTIGAMRSVWFVLFASVAGSVSTKYITQQADIGQGVYAFVFGEAVVMIAMWLLYYAIKRPLPASSMFGPRAVRTGMTVGAVAAFATAATVYAVYHVDNPAYITAVRYLDSILILLYYRATGKPSKGHVYAGLGIVACAAALVILKSGG